MTMMARLTAAALLIVAPACGSAEGKPLIPELQRLADAGDAEALYHIGMAYHTGSGVGRDGAKALAAFRKAAAMGDPLAAYKLGCYFDGQGEGLAEEDAEQALKHKLVAAEAGYALAQQDTAALYARRGDLKTALGWIERSAAQGWSGGLMTLSSVHNGALGVAADPAKTAAYFKLFLERADASDEQRAWLAAFEKDLTPGQRRRADAIVRGYQPKPTALTIKALSGRRAAEALAASASAHPRTAER